MGEFNHQELQASSISRSNSTCHVGEMEPCFYAKMRQAVRRDHCNVLAEMSSLGTGQVKQVLMGLDGMSMAQCNLRDLQQTGGAHLCVCVYGAHVSKAGP